MWQFFDYFYYSTCEDYKRPEKDSGFEFAAIVFISAVQGINLISVIFASYIMLQRQFNVSKLEALFIAVALLAFNIIRYNKYGYDYFKEKWKHEQENKRLKRKYLLRGYVILSIVLFIVVGEWRCR